MEYTIKNYKIPSGAESIVDNMVAVGVERFLKEQMAIPPIEEKVEYQQAVDTFRTENNMTTKFTKIEIEEPLLEEVNLEEPLIIK